MSVHFCEDLVHVKVMVAEVFHHQFKLPSVQCTAVIGVECFEIFVRHTDALKLGAIVQSLEPFSASKPILEFFIRDPLVAVFVQEEKVNFRLMKVESKRFLQERFHFSFVEFSGSSYIIFIKKTVDSDRWNVSIEITAKSARHLCEELISWVVTA